jgi:hypothetical protein
MIVSKSGFIIKDVYDDLRQSLFSHNFVRICHLSAELVCSSQVKALLNWIISLVCNQYIVTNAYMFHFIHTKIEEIKDQGFKWKSIEVRKAICEIVMVLAKEEQHDSVFYKKDGGSGYKEFVESLYFSRPRTYPEVDDNLQYIKESEHFMTLVHLYEYMMQNDIKSVYRILYYIIHNIKTLEECETLDIVQQVKTKSAKNDPVWVLWKLLFVYVERPPANQQTRLYVHSAFSLFCFEYNKKIRKERLNLLFACYLICVKRKQIIYENTYDDTIQSASNRIHIVYTEILEDEKRKTKLVKEQQVKEKKEKKTMKTGPKSNLTPEQLKELNEKLKYIFVTTYKKPKSQYISNVPKSFVTEKESYKVLNVSGNDLGKIEPDSSQAVEIEKLLQR